MNAGGGIGGLLNLRQSGAEYSYLYDGKGNVMAVIDGSQSVVAAYRYSPFGKLLSKSGTLDQSYTFSTKRYDESTGLNYYGFRYYNPAIGRWLTRDPLGEIGGMNLYGFVRQNPVNWTDSWGLLPIGPIWGPNGLGPNPARSNDLGLKGIHYSRNRYNNPPQKVQAAFDANWSRLPPWQNIYHQFGQGNQCNVKYISPDGHQEGIYDTSGNLITDQANMGTYNFANPDNVMHIPLDVIPYWLWGNTPDDPTPAINRIFGPNSSSAEIKENL